MLSLKQFLEKVLDYKSKKNRIKKFVIKNVKNFRDIKKKVLNFFKAYLKLPGRYKNGIFVRYMTMDETWLYNNTQN